MALSTATVVLLTLIAYKLVLIGIGLWAVSRNRGLTDYLLGGRRLGAFVAGLSYAASTSSAWVLLGFSGFVYAVGLSAIWMVFGILGGYAVVWLYLGRRLREESLAHDQLTLTDFLLQDADAGKRAPAAALAALLVIGCFVFYIAAQFGAAGAALAEHFALSVPQAVWTGAAIVVIYALLGGYWAVSVTDTLQAVIMVFVAAGVPLVVLVAAGGPAGVFSTLSETMPASYLQVTGGHAGLVLAGFLIGVIGMSLGTLGQPQLLSRLMAVRGEKERLRGFGIVFGWGLLVFGGMMTLGLAGRALLPGLPNGEALFYSAASELLPTVLAGIVIAAILSAVMSTVDSLLIASTGAVTNDLGVARRFPGWQMTVSRLVTLALALLAVLLTLALPDTIFNRVLFAWSALGAAFGPIVLLRVLGYRIGAGAALASMSAGFSVTVLFYLLGAMPAGEGLLSSAAHLPGDPFERVFPWLPALGACAAGSRKAA